MNLTELLEMESKKIRILYSPCTYASYCLGRHYGLECKPDDGSCAYFALQGGVNNQKKALEGDNYERKTRL